MKLESFTLLCIFIWIGLLIPFDPWKKNILYKNKSRVRFFLAMIGSIGFVNTIFYSLVMDTNREILRHLNIVFDVLSILGIIASATMLVGFLKLKEQGWASCLMKVFAVVLFIFSVIYSLLLSIKSFTPDLYLLFAPQFGVITITSYEYSTKKNTI